MTSPLAALRADLATEIAALTPSSGPAWRFLGHQRTVGAGVHRVFWFEWAGVTDEIDMGATLSFAQHDFSLVVRMSSAGLTPTAMFDALPSDAATLARAINTRVAVTAGVDRVWNDRAFVRAPAEGGDDLELVLTLHARTQET